MNTYQQNNMMRLAYVATVLSVLTRVNYTQPAHVSVQRQDGTEISRIPQFLKSHFKKGFDGKTTHRTTPETTDVFTLPHDSPITAHDISVITQRLIDRKQSSNFAHIIEQESLEQKLHTLLLSHYFGIEEIYELERSLIIKELVSTESLKAFLNKPYILNLLKKISSHLSDDIADHIRTRNKYASVKVLKGHADIAVSVHWNHNGTQLVSASQDRTAIIWNTSMGNIAFILKGHQDNVRTAQFSPDDLKVATISRDKTARIWNAKTGECLHILKGHTDDVTCLSWEKDSTHVATGSKDATVRIWNIETGQCEHTLTQHHGPIYFVTFDHTGTMLASGSHDNSAIIWNLGQDTPTHTELLGHNGFVYSGAFSPNDSHLATSSRDHTVRVWDLKTYASTEVFQYRHKSDVKSITWHPDGTRIVSGDSSLLACIWKLSSPQPLHMLRGHYGGIPSISLHHDGTLLATASYDHTVKIWDTSNGSCVRTLNDYADVVTSVAFHPNNHYLASSSSDNKIRIHPTMDLLPQSYTLTQIILILAFEYYQLTGETPTLHQDIRQLVSTFTQEEQRQLRQTYPMLLTADQQSSHGNP